MRTRKNRSIYSAYDMRKLSLLIACFNHYRTAGQAAKDTLIPGELPTTHKDAVKKTLSRLRHYFKHPYLKSEHLKKGKEGCHIAYKCTAKGRKVACELFYRKKKGMNLIWNGRYHVICARTCEECQHNPTLQADHKEIIEKADLRPKFLIRCHFCDYKKTAVIPEDADGDFIALVKNTILARHIEKEHQDTRDFNDSRRRIRQPRE